MISYRKLCLSKDFKDRILAFADSLNNHIFKQLAVPKKSYPLYWIVSSTIPNYSYGYEFKNHKEHINIKVDKWSSLKINNLKDSELFQELDFMELVFALYEHNFAVHRHAEHVDKTKDYLKYVLVISKIEGELKLCRVDAEPFKIESGKNSHIDHLPPDQFYYVDENIKVSVGDVFIFNSSNWHTFFVPDQIKDKQFYTMTFVIDKTDAEIEEYCLKLESI